MALNYISRLPSDLLDLILHRLPVVDYVRSGAVCRSWRQATAGNPHRLDTTTPWLMLPGTCEVCGRLLYRFFSIPDLTQHKHRFRIPQTRGRITGSSHGIIMIFRLEEIILLDPLTGAELRMPAAPSFPSRILKLFFSPSKSVAVAMYVGGGYYMSFARVGDRSWTMLRTEETYDHLHDIIIHKGEFYAVNNTGTILSFDPAQGAILTVRGYGDASFTGLGWNPIKMFLVESLDGDHLLLLRRMLNKEGRTESFKVFTQDKVGRRWVEVVSLGEVAIFVGTNNSTCIFTRGLRGMRGNCIYFTPSSTFATEPRRHNFGVFSLENGSIEQLDSLHHIPLNRWAPFWLMRS